MRYHGSDTFVDAAQKFYRARVELSTTDRDAGERLYKSLLALDNLGVSDVPIATERLLLRVKRLVGFRHFVPDRSTDTLRKAVDALPARQCLQAIGLLIAAGASMRRFSLVETDDHCRDSDAGSRLCLVRLFLSNIFS